MKINKILFGFAIVMAALFTSCNKDNEGAIYNNQEGAGLSFTASTLVAVEVPASNPVFEVEILRGNISGAASGNVTATLKVGETELSGVTVSGYNFADGQNSTTSACMRSTTTGPDLSGSTRTTRTEVSIPSSASALLRRRAFCSS